MEYRVVGKSYPRHESYSKVTGQAIYTGDIRLPGMAYGALLRSPHAHARVLNMDTGEAMNTPGVLGVLLPQDVPQTLFNSSGNPPSPILIKSERILTEHPLHVGDRVAAVVAESPRACMVALEKIKVEYEVLPAIFKIKAALAKGASLVRPDLGDSNIVKTITARQGDVDAGFAESDFVFSDEFFAPSVQHVALEPIGCVCHFTSAGKLNIWSTSQTPFQERRILSELLDLPESDIRIVKPVMGGGFGARQQLHFQHVGALLSKQINRPVKMINTREEEMIGSVVRHEANVKLKAGVTRDGRLQAFHARVYLNTGPYPGHGPTVAAAASRKLQYRTSHYLYEGHCVLTNGPAAGAMRGYGNPQLTFAREVFLDRICRELEMDPVKFRMMNHIRVGDTIAATTSPIKSCAIKDCMEGAQRIKGKIGARQKVAGNCPNTPKEAWGVAFGCHTSGPSSKEGMSTSVIIANDDGSIQLLTGSADIGQGSETALGQVAAETLGIDFSDVTVNAADTGTTPYDTGTFASSQMYVGGNAVHQAALNLIENLKVALGQKYKVSPDDVLWEKGRVSILKEKSPGIMTFKESVRDVAFGMGGTMLLGSANFNAQDSPPPFSVCWARVAVDPHTHSVTVKDVIQAVDVGTAVNPKIVAGQVHGGIAMGVGYAMMEQIEIDPRARKPISTDLLHYKLPLATDLPRTHVHIADSHEPTGPLGAKSVGELSVVAVAPAIVNAIVNACGTPITRLPVSTAVYNQTDKGRPKASALEDTPEGSK